MEPPHSLTGVLFAYVGELDPNCVIWSLVPPEVITDLENHMAMQHQTAETDATTTYNTTLPVDIAEVEWVGLNRDQDVLVPINLALHGFPDPMAGYYDTIVPVGLTGHEWFEHMEVHHTTSPEDITDDEWFAAMTEYHSTLPETITDDEWFAAMSAHHSTLPEDITDDEWFAAMSAHHCTLTESSTP